MSVVLPAPLPPTTPTTSPGYRSRVTPATARTPPNATWMFRSSTSGTRGPATPCASGVRVSIARSTHSPTEHGVEADRRDEHDADHDVLSWRIDKEQHHTRAQR